MNHHENLGRISRSLNSMLTVIIGPEVFLNVRRTTTDLRDDLSRIHIELMNLEFTPCYSGSKAEGLRFESSDEDWMFINMIHQSYPVRILYIHIRQQHDVFLWWKTRKQNRDFHCLDWLVNQQSQLSTRSTENILNGRYLSCKRWRESYTADSRGLNCDKNFTHGPCTSGIVGPNVEYDFACCIKCDFWPANAQDCVRRLHQIGWPSRDTVLSIVSDGVLFVPIGAKKSNFENSEWRMSFSLAEKKLIHAMDHSQFLCYGLQKIFLKEAIVVNPDVKGLLCSYFLKTAILWEITTSSNRWNPSNTVVLLLELL